MSIPEIVQYFESLFRTMKSLLIGKAASWEMFKCLLPRLVNWYKKRRALWPMSREREKRLVEREALFLFIYPTRYSHSLYISLTSCLFLATEISIACKFVTFTRLHKYMIYFACLMTYYIWHYYDYSTFYYLWFI